MTVTPAMMAGLYLAKTGLDFVGNQKAATGAQQAGDYQAGIYNQNATFAEAQATDALNRGQLAEQRHRAEIRGLIGSQKTAFAASGVNIDSGSALDVQTNDAGMGALDELTIRNDAAKEAWGYRVQAADYRSKSQLSRIAGSNTAQSYRNASYSTLLTGAGNIASVYRK